MILKALYDYYQKHDQLPRAGFTEKEFKYLIVIRKDGSFDHLECLIPDTKKKNGQIFVVPLGKGRTGKNSWQTAYLLWDHYGYLLKYAQADDDPDKQLKNNQLAELQNQQFIKQLQNLPAELKQDDGVNAVLEFYRNNEYEKVLLAPEGPNCAKIPNCNLTFKLKGDFDPIPCRKAVKEYIINCALNEENPNTEKSGCCLVTGKHTGLSRLMRPTSIPGGKATSALVSFQTNSGYDSYGKEQCYNAPISLEANFACTTALNSLLSKESNNRFSLGNITAAFWVESKVSSFSPENMLRIMIKPDKEQAEENVTAMRKLCEAVYSGKLPAEDRSIRYYFLGLSPNAARICVSFWKSGTVGEFAQNIAQHFQDLTITDGREYPALISLLSAVDHEYKMDNVPSNLPPRMFDAIFNGTQYPCVWYNLCLQRVHNEHAVTSLRASILKAFLNRKIRLQNLTNQYKEISMSFDSENPSIAYQSGALFALLVKAQEEANPGINATITDRFFAAASTQPATVFGTLLRLNRAHLKKLSPGRKINFERMIGEIADRIGDHFPIHFCPDDQGRFCLGYYQYRQKLFESKVKNTDELNNENNETENKGE